jgi:hypothetical protein
MSSSFRGDANRLLENAPRNPLYDFHTIEVAPSPTNNLNGSQPGPDRDQSSQFRAQPQQVRRQSSQRYSSSITPSSSSSTYSLDSHDMNPASAAAASNENVNPNSYPSSHQPSRFNDHRPPAASNPSFGSRISSMFHTGDSAFTKMHDAFEPSGAQLPNGPYFDPGKIAQFDKFIVFFSLMYKVIYLCISELDRSARSEKQRSTPQQPQQQQPQQYSKQQMQMQREREREREQFQQYQQYQQQQQQQQFQKEQFGAHPMQREEFAAPQSSQQFESSVPNERSASAARARALPPQQLQQPGPPILVQEQSWVRWFYNQFMAFWALFEGELTWLNKVEFMDSSLLLHDAHGWIPIVVAFSLVTLRGIGQVVFMNSPWAGFLIWFGLVVQSPFTAFCCLWSTGWATWCAYFWKLPRDKFEAGLYGCAAARQFFCSL